MTSATTRIIVVNDDPMQLALIVRLLENDHNVVGFTDPEEALRYVREDRSIGLFIVDLHMPVLDGWRFCRLLRSPAYPIFRDTPILVVSATYAGVDVEAVTADLGAHAFLPVPFTAEALRDSVTDLLRGQRPQFGLSVLIVDDDPAVRTAIRAGFEANRYTTYVASNAEEALHQVQRVTPDVVIVDYHLPDMDGATLLRMIGRTSDSTTAIAMTGDDDPDLAITLLGSGAAAFLRKPFDIDYLVRMTENARRERSLLRIEEILEGRTQQLRASEALYRSLFNTIPEPVLLLDNQGRILQANDAAEHALGPAGGQLVTSSFEALAADGPTGALAESIRNCWRSGLGAFESSLTPPTGETIEVEISARVVDYQGNKALLVLSRDVTEHRRIEEERRVIEDKAHHTQKLESLGLLAGGIAHDFNNLLMSVLGNASLALDDLTPSHPAHESLNQIQIAAERAAELTGQILTYSGRQRAEMTSLHLSSLVREMGQLLAPAVSKKASIKYDLSSDSPQVKGDAGQLRQVVMNLIMNASDSLGGESGEITVCTTTIEAEEGTFKHSFLAQDLAPGTYAVLRVSDTGCGMDIDTQRRMFDPFYSTKLSGRGLGLASVLGIVRSHGGAIHVRSTPGQGTTVSVSLPIAEGIEGHTRSTPRGEEQDDPRGQGVILVVDDEPAVRAVVKSALERIGFDVLLAEDGEQGLAFFRANHTSIQLTLLDMTMPGLDGNEVLEGIRRLDPDAPVILSSGHPLEEAAEAREEDGKTSFLQKPYQPTSLFKAIGDMLESTAQAPESASA